MTSQLLETIDINAGVPVRTLSEVMSSLPDRERWELRNDMIKCVKVHSCDHGFLSLGVDYASGQQGVGYGYRSEANIGVMINALAELVGEKYINGDILKAMEGKPIRVLFKFSAGAPVAECTYIGHFMEDKFIYFHDLIMAGYVEEVKEPTAKTERKLKS